MKTSTQTYILGVLTLIISATLYTAIFQNDFKIDMTKTNTKFYVNESNKWVLAGTEYNILLDQNNKTVIGTDQFMQNEISGNKTTLRRYALYQPNKEHIEIHDEYVFNGNLKDKEQFPVGHKVTITGAIGKKYVYQVRDLQQIGKDIQSISGNEMRFGHSMKVTWSSGYSSASLKNGVLTLTYDIKSKNQEYDVRLFDPATTPIDPTATGFGADSYYGNIKTLRAAWDKSGNVTFLTTNTTGSPIMIVPWQARADTCGMTQNTSSGLHACTTNTSTQWRPQDLNNTNFCMVTDEMSQVFLVDSMLENNTIQEAWLNTISSIQCQAASGLTEWTTGVSKNVTGYYFDCGQVTDNAMDADAQITAGLGHIANNPFSNSTVKARALVMLQNSCHSLVDLNIINVTLKNNIRSGTITRLPCGGTNVCAGGTTSGDFMFTAYSGSLLEALAVCNAAFNDSVGYNYSRDADMVVQAHLQASNWTYLANSFSVGNGRAYKWLSNNQSSCTTSCNTTLIGSTAYPDDPDGMRWVRIEQGDWIWQFYRAVTFTNISTYIQQVNALTGETSTQHVLERWYNGTAKSSTTDSGYKAAGLGMSLRAINNSYQAPLLLDSYETHIAACPNCEFDSQSCMGVYDKAFGMINSLVLMGKGYGFNASSAGGGGATNNGTGFQVNYTDNNFVIVINSPYNQSVSSSGNITFNVTVYNMNTTNGTTAGAAITLPQLVCDWNFTGAGSSSQSFILNSGWLWNNVSGIFYNSSSFGSTLYSVPCALSTYTLGYNLSFFFGSVGNVTNQKVWINTGNVSNVNADYNMEAQNGTAQHFKYDGGHFSNTNNYPADTNQTIDIFVNESNVILNNTKACIRGGTCSGLENGSIITTPQDSIAISPGTVQGSGGLATTNLSRLQVWNTANGVGVATITNCSPVMNITILWTNGSIIGTNSTIVNGSTTSFTINSIPTGNYTWNITVRSCNTNLSLAPELFNSTFTASNPVPTVSYGVGNPPNATRNNTQGYLNLSCSQPGADFTLFFGTATTPVNGVVNYSEISNYTTHVFNAGTYYYRGFCNNTNGTSANSSTQQWIYDNNNPNALFQPNNAYDSSNNSQNSACNGQVILNMSFTDDLSMYNYTIYIYNSTSFVMFNISNTSSLPNPVNFYTLLNSSTWNNGTYRFNVTIADLGYNNTNLNVVNYYNALALTNTCPPTGGGNITINPALNSTDVFINFNLINYSIFNSLNGNLTWTLVQIGANFTASYWFTVNTNGTINNATMNVTPYNTSIFQLRCNNTNITNIQKSVFYQSQSANINCVIDLNLSQSRVNWSLVFDQTNYSFGYTASVV